MTSVDPSTGQSLPADAIQRVLHITANVHVYAIPPLQSNKGYTAASWTINEPIITARLRVIETAVPSQGALAVSHGASSGNEKVTTAIVLEDRSTGELFAAAPYNHPSVVAQAVDSSRFYAVRVVGEGGRKATLGVGFEERTDSFDFGVSLQDAGKVLGFADAGAAAGKRKDPITKEADKKDYSLKEGQTITLNLAGKSKRPATSVDEKPDRCMNSLSGATILPPPPSARDVKRGDRNTSPLKEAWKASAKDLGFDDGEFGEFQ